MGFLVVRGGRLTFLEPAQSYEWALDSALLQVQSGAISYNQAIATAVRQLADSGLCIAYDKDGNPIKNRVAYESKKTPGKQGHVDHLDVAVRRAVMTGVNQLNQKYREQSMDYLETDLVEVTAHLGARNVDGPNGWENHEKWQGRWYRWKEYTLKYPGTSKGDYPDFEETCGYGSVTGIGGPNCRHSFHSVVEGVNEPTYSEADLEALKGENHKFTFGGKEYDGYSATQMQRRIETTVRELKRRKAAFEAAGLTEEAKAAKEPAVAILLSSALSGTLQSALIAKEMCGYDPIYIVDSMTATAGIQILVNYACKLRDSGLPAAGIAEEVERLKDQVRVFAVVDTLEYLRRGGRLTGLQAGLGSAELF